MHSIRLWAICFAILSPAGTAHTNRLMPCDAKAPFSASASGKVSSKRKLQNMSQGASMARECAGEMGCLCPRSFVSEKFCVRGGCVFGLLLRCRDVHVDCRHPQHRCAPEHLGLGRGRVAYYRLSSLTGEMGCLCPRSSVSSAFYSAVFVHPVLSTRRLPSGFCGQHHCLHIGSCCRPIGSCP